MIKILYIHKLSDLQRKSAEVESVYIVRELKQKMKLPLSEAALSTHFSQFFSSESDHTALNDALNLVPITVEKVKSVLQKEDNLYEKVNLQRTEQLLKALPDPLFNNLVFLKNTFDWQNEFIKESSIVLNALPRLRSKDEKINYNNRLNAIFLKILRNPEFGFNFYDIINEKQIFEINGLIESMAKGYFFHITLEEELKKNDFAHIKTRIPQDDLQAVQSIEQDLAVIMKGIRRAYDANMRIVNCALVFYAYVKWMMNP